VFCFFFFSFKFLSISGKVRESFTTTQVVCSMKKLVIACLHDLHCCGSVTADNGKLTNKQFSFLLLSP